VLKLLEETLQFKFDNEIAILKYEGKIIFENSNQLKEEIKNLLSKKEKIKKIILDLSQVFHLDSAGVGVIISLFRFIRKKGGSLVAVNLNEQVRKVFKITKMEKIIPIVENIEQAVNEKISL